MKVSLLWASILAAFVFASVFASAQQATGIISGRVTDVQGLAIVGAKISVINVDTHYRQKVVTGDEGLFRFPALPIGTYDVVIEKQAFRTVKHTGVTLSERQDVPLSTVLPVGEATEQIVVIAESPVVNTENAVVQNTFQEQQVVRFGVDRLIATLPQNTGGGIEGWLTFNGGRTEYNRWTIDGAQNQESLNRTAGHSPDVEAIQEVDVVSTLAKAEQGQSSAQINIVTKSGSDKFHGHAAVPLPNSWNLVARNFFQARTKDPSGNPVDPKSTGIAYYSGSAGGPVRIPGLYDGRGKTHFFALYGGQRSSSPILTNLNFGVVPSNEFRNGEFSSLLPPAGTIGGTGVVRDPVSGQPFPNNQIPADRINPLARKIIDTYYPDSNSPGGLYYNSALNELSLDNFTMKVDHRVGERHALSFNANGNFSGTEIPASALPAFVNDSQYKDIRFGMSDIFTVTPNVLNEFRAMVYRNHLTLDPLNSVNPADFGFTGIHAPTPMLPTLSITGYATVGFPSQVDEITNSFQIKDDISWSRGKHGLKFGIDHVWNQGVQNNHILTSGQFLFLGLVSAGVCPAPYYYCGGNAFADFLLGKPYVYSQYSPAQSDIRYRALNLYVQDDWRVLPRLTLNLGLRWEGNSAPADSKRRMSAYRPGQKSQRYPNAPAGIVFPGDPGVPDGTVEADLNNLAPRFGFALDVTGKATTVLRGGYGIYYQTNPLRQAIQGSVNQPFSLSVSLLPTLVNPPPDPLKDPFGITPNPFPYDHSEAAFITPYNIIGLAEDYVTPYSQQFSLELERQLFSPDYMLSVGYIGMLGTHLQGHNEYNAAKYVPGATILDIQARRPDQNFSTVHLYDSRATSNFHAMVVSFTKRYNNGVNFNAGYTWSKNIDSQSLNYGPLPQNPYDLSAERALSTMDVRHKFSGTFIWDLPLWRNQRRPVQKILGGWQLNGLWNFHSGSPMNLQTGSNKSLNGVYTDRPDQIGDWRLPSNRSNIEKAAAWYDVNAFVENAEGTFGNSRRNTIIGPNYKSVDLGLVKKFPLRESQRLEFETHITNVFNRVNFQGYLTPALNAPNRGELAQAYAGRNMSFILKFYY